MLRMISIVILGGILAWTPASFASSELPENTLRVAPFGRVIVYRQSDRPANVVLFLSGDGGWNKGVVGMARSISGLDALVAGISLPEYLPRLQASPARFD
jgi:hypothetical protein